MMSTNNLSDVASSNARLNVSRVQAQKESLFGKGEMCTAQEAYQKKIESLKMMGKAYCILLLLTSKISVDMVVERRNFEVGLQDP